MADTKTIVAKKAAIGIPCPKKSVFKKEKDEKGVVRTLSEYEYVELKHVEPGVAVTIDADEADRLIRLGFAEEVVEKAAPKTAEK